MQIILSILDDTGETGPHATRIGDSGFYAQRVNLQFSDAAYATTGIFSCLAALGSNAAPRADLHA